MRPRRVLTQTDAIELFDRAVEERALAVLSFRDDGDWQTLKSRFLERDPRGRFFVLDYQAFGSERAPALTPGQYVGVSFRQRGRKLLFATVVEARGHFVMSDHAQVPAMRYRWPQTITELQRRAYFRTPVPEGVRLAAALWPGGLQKRPNKAAADGATMVVGELVDLSCGGAFVRTNRADALPWSDEQAVGVELQLPDGRPPVLLDARSRGVRADSESGSGIAIQFIGLELSANGDVVLQRLAQSVQRLHQLALATTRRAVRGEL